MGCVGLQQHETSAPRVAGLLVNIQLEVLVFVQETSSGLADSEMLVVLLVQEVRVVSVSEGSFHLNHLSAHLL